MYLDTLELLEALPSTADKQKLLSDVREWDADICRLLDAVYSPRRCFFVDQLPPVDQPAPYVGGHLTELLDVLLPSLETGQLTGDAARDAVVAFLSKCTPLERKWFSRVLLKDLKIGVDALALRQAGYIIGEEEG